jgi:hypothetical protein
VESDHLPPVTFHYLLTASTLVMCALRGGTIGVSPRFFIHPGNKYLKMVFDWLDMIGNGE